MTFISATILLLLVIDPFGAVPLFLAALGQVDPKRRVGVVIRECLIALLVLLTFLVCGESLLELLQISQTSLGIAGGIILFMIALHMIFPSTKGLFGDAPQGEPFIVPLAIPLIAGPSAIATVLLMVSRWPEQSMKWAAAVCTAALLSTLILASSQSIAKFMGERGLMAIERLMGLILTVLAVQMFVDGVREFIHSL
ncbi:MAG: NAAT family transporter [Deltaproteobacteria bacterium]|nr:NAAT family transporter [Deltaproteobacteria bacterium]